MQSSSKQAQSDASHQHTNHQTSRQTNGSVLEVFICFLKLGLTSFGGPIAHLGYFHKAFVENKKWLSESQYAQLLAICQFLPGPASSQMGFSIGLMRAGWLGALAAFIAFTLPSVLILALFASSLSLFSNPLGLAVIQGLKVVAFAVVADALIAMFSKLCPDKTRRIIALFTMASLVVFSSAWIQVILVMLAGFAGLWFCQSETQQANDNLNIPYQHSLGFSFLALFILLLLLLPLLSDQAFVLSIADAFYRTGSMVFGGGHVVLPLLETSVVEPGWVTKEIFLAGYGASQAIPGPMFAFASFLGALIPSADSEGIQIGTSLLALVFIFLPGFLLICAILPFWQSLAQSTKASKAINGVNAAVVGLLGAALYDPIFSSGINSGTDLAIGLIALGLLRIWQLSPLWVVGWCIGAFVVIAQLQA